MLCRCDTEQNECFMPVPPQQKNVSPEINNFVSRFEGHFARQSNKTKQKVSTVPR
jgi:hypothetical protein